MSHFGEYSYGTEILEIPSFEDGFTTVPQSSELIESLTREPAIDEPPNASDKYWFRWVTGHQTMLVLWHLITVNLSKVIDEPNLHYLKRCTDLFKGCSIIFEYTGAVDKDFYHQYIRKFMALSHKGFTGLWAADYKYLPDLTRRALALSDPLLKHELSNFKDAYRISQKTHFKVAQQLVPEGASLLKDAKKEGHSFMKHSAYHSMLFDNFFLVHRRSITKKQLAHNLEKRLIAIAQDLAQESEETIRKIFPTKSRKEIIQLFECITEGFQNEYQSIDRTK